MRIMRIIITAHDWHRRATNIPAVPIETHDSQMDSCYPIENPLYLRNHDGWLAVHTDLNFYSPDIQYMA